MTIKELKEYVRALPEQYDDYSLMVRSVHESNEETEAEIIDNPVFFVCLDEGYQVMCMVDEYHTEKIMTIINEEDSTETDF